jgi:hypothetical protein
MRVASLCHGIVQQAAEYVVAGRVVQFDRERAVDEDERHPRGLPGPVFPAVAGAALHHDVAGPQHRLASSSTRRLHG